MHSPQMFPSQNHCESFGECVRHTQIQSSFACKLSFQWSESSEYCENPVDATVVRESHFIVTSCRFMFVLYAQFISVASSSITASLFPVSISCLQRCFIFAIAYDFLNVPFGCSLAVRCFPSNVEHFSHHPRLFVPIYYWAKYQNVFILFWCAHFIMFSFSSLRYFPIVQHFINVIVAWAGWNAPDTKLQ